MQQIRFRLRLGSRTHWGSSQRSPRPPSRPSWILGGPTSKGREERKKKATGRERGERGRVRKERDKRGKEREGEGRRGPQLKFLVTPLYD